MVILLYFQAFGAILKLPKIFAYIVVYGVIDKGSFGCLKVN